MKRGRSKEQWEREVVRSQRVKKTRELMTDLFDKGMNSMEAQADMRRREDRGKKSEEAVEEALKGMKEVESVTKAGLIQDGLNGLDYVVRVRVGDELWRFNVQVKSCDEAVTEFMRDHFPTNGEAYLPYEVLKRRMAAKKWAVLNGHGGEGEAKEIQNQFREWMVLRAEVLGLMVN